MVLLAPLNLPRKKLSTFPLSGRAGALATTRELVVPRFPYIIVYRLSVDCIEIIGMFHAAQDLPRG